MANIQTYGPASLAPSSVKTNQDNLKNALQQLEGALKVKETAATAWKNKYGIMTQQERELAERANATQKR